MAECYNAKEIDKDSSEPKSQIVYDIEPQDVITGDTDRNRFLYYQLKMSFSRAKKIDIIVSFLMESGVRLMLKDFKAALDKGVEIRLLTGNYLGITQPSALYLLKKELDDRIDLRFYNNTARAFHPKAYIFHHDNYNEIYIGSSNISRSALTSGIEWNYRFTDHKDGNNYHQFLNTFEDLFYQHSIIINEAVLKVYAKAWKKPAAQKDLERYDEVEDLNKSVHKADKIAELFQPRGVQIEALYSLDASRKEGADKGLIYAATGIGKTYLAAFDSKDYQKVLFVAHREEILYQAAESFCNVRKTDDYGFFKSNKKDTKNSVIFASVSSLGKSEYLQPEYFTPDYFDYIVIDEFHHAVNEQYKKVMSYFKPKYLLGLTATPERMDGRNIYELCDYIVPYQLSLKEAINKGVLVPFHYYGIYDDTVDYRKIHLVKGRYNEAELNESLLRVKRYDLIYKHYMKYRSHRALGFCCSREHAEKMAEEFSKHGIPSVAVYSNSQGEFSEDRKIAIDKLRKGRIRIIFSVDMFNEGVDIKGIDMVMFLRPTESPVVFLQQLGRGLRRDQGKEYLNVLDFIGNYEKAANAPFLLSEQSYSRETALRSNQQDYEFPDGCMVDFDLRLIDLFHEMSKRGLIKQERIKEEFFRIKELLDGEVPTRMELFTNMTEEVYELCLNTPKENPFNHYLDFLFEMQELDIEETKLYNGIGREFLNLLETTRMEKSYKMPILLAFYNAGNIKMGITEEEVYLSYLNFYQQGVNWKDLEKDKSSNSYKQWDRTKYISEARKNPIHFLKESGKGFFVEKEGYALSLNEEMRDVIDLKVFQDHMIDIIEYRVMNYYRKRYKEEE